MSALLFRVGRGAYARPWRVIGAWLALLVVIGGVLAASPPKLTSDVRIEGTAAQQVIDELTAALPEAAGGQGLLVFEAAHGKTFDDPASAAALRTAVDRVYAARHVIDAGAEAQLSPDRSAAILQFQFDRQTFELPGGTVERLVDAARAAGEPAGVRVLPSASMLELPDVIGPGEVVGVLVAALVLLVTLGSVVAAGLPLLGALTGVALGVGGALSLSSLFNLHSLGVVLALMLGLAVGIDYALFIVNRQRRLIFEQRLNARDAAAQAIATAGTAVVFAGSTVVIALLGLLLVGVELLSVMALIAAATVAIAVLVAITLLPALLGLVGERICSPAARSKHAVERHGMAKRWSGWIVRHRWATVAGTVALAATLAIPATDMELGLPSGASYNAGTPQRDAYEIVRDRFGPGFNGPLLVVLHDQRPDATIARLQAIEGVTAVAPAGQSRDGRTSVLSVIPRGGPNDAETKAVIERIRATGVGVTGFAALAIDVSDKLAGVLPAYIGVIGVLSLLILLFVFRSIVIPIKATAGFLLSIAATLGLTTAVFQWGWLQGLLGMDATTPVLSLLPIIVTGVLYGLAMDYQVFLVSSMRHAHLAGMRGDAAVTSGFTHASRVVVAAAVIMFSVFGGFVFNAEPMVKQVGFALAAGVLVDAFLVRLTFVPAVMAIVGDRAWWLPRRLDGVLPALDVEGEATSS